MRELIKMFELRSKDAVDEAQQTLDYFGIDDSAVKDIREHMEREAHTQPLVRLQKLSWVMGAHGRLGANSTTLMLADNLIKKVGQCIPAAARPAVAFRWETQGLVWVQPLDWQRRAHIAETSVVKKVSGDRSYVAVFFAHVSTWRAACRVRAGGRAGAS